jgi:hypothetical protein
MPYPTAGKLVSLSLALFFLLFLYFCCFKFKILGLGLCQLTTLLPALSKLYFRATLKVGRWDRREGRGRKAGKKYKGGQVDSTKKVKFRGQEGLKVEKESQESLDAVIMIVQVHNTDYAVTHAFLMGDFPLSTLIIPSSSPDLTAASLLGIVYKPVERGRNQEVSHGIVRYIRTRL